MPGTDLAKFEYKKCTVVGFPKCKVKEPIKVAEATKVGKVAAKFDDTGEVTPVTVEIAGAECTLAANYEMTGDNVAEIDNATEELIYPETPIEGSTLKLGSASATLVSDIRLELGGSEKWEVGEE